MNLDQYGLDPTELAFERAQSGYYFSGFASPDNPHGLLEPYSIRHKRAAGSLGLKWGKLSGDEATEAMNTSVYPGIEQDVLRVIWVCTQPIKSINRVLRFPDLADEEMNSWGDSVGIDSSGDKWREALNVFWDIILDIENSKATDGAEPEARGGEEPGKPLAMPQDMKSPSHGQPATTPNTAAHASPTPLAYNSSQPMQVNGA